MATCTLSRLLHFSATKRELLSIDLPHRGGYFYGTLAASGGGVPPDSNCVTDLLVRWNAGDESARDALVPLVYDELRRIARRHIASQRGHTLQPTALVHEAYLRLASRDASAFRDRVHFFALASQVMRQVLIDYARKAAAAKRGSNPVTVQFDEALTSDRDRPEQSTLDLIALDNAMTRLAELDPRQSKIVELRFFGGLSIEETAQAVRISPTTANREWATARLWLHRAISDPAAS